MKKFITIALVLIMALTMLVGCGNMSLGLGNFTFKKIHVDTHHYSGCLTVVRWYENDNGVEVETKEVGNIFLSEGTYVLIEKECPFCCHEEGE